MTPRARAFCSSGLRNFLNRVSTQQLLKGLATVPGHHTESYPLERLGGRAKPANEGRVKTGQRGTHSGH